MIDQVGKRKSIASCKDALFSFVGAVGFGLCCANTQQTMCVVPPKYDSGILKILFVTGRLVT